MSVERSVRLRRYKRRIKAAVSIVIALAAGTFLACQRQQAAERPRSAPNPNPNPPGRAALDASSPGEPGELVERVPIDAGVADANADSAKPSVDKQEHRNGMPVKDNLLE